MICVIRAVVGAWYWIVSRVQDASRKGSQTEGHSTLFLQGRVSSAVS